MEESPKVESVVSETPISSTGAMVMLTSFAQTGGLNEEVAARLQGVIQSISYDFQGNSAKPLHPVSSSTVPLNIQEEQQGIQNSSVDQVPSTNDKSNTNSIPTPTTPISDPQIALNEARQENARIQDENKKQKSEKKAAKKAAKKARKEAKKSAKKEKKRRSKQDSDEQPPEKRLKSEGA